MFEQFKDMASIAGLMKDLPKLKARLEEVKRQLASITAEAETGGGAVRVVANGEMRIVSIQIDPSMMGGLVNADDPGDRAIAEDLIAGAVNAALTKARETAEQEMHRVAGDMGLPIPPGGPMEGLLP